MVRHGESTSPGASVQGGISMELMIVSAVAGLGFFVAIVALAVAYQARRSGRNDEKHLR